MRLRLAATLCALYLALFLAGCRCCPETAEEAGLPARVDGPRAAPSR